MLLSKLIYLAVKEVIYLDDTSFTYDAFKNGDFNNDPDYATNINNVFSPINEAIQRLSDLDKLPYKVKNIGVINKREIDLNDIDEELNIKDMINIFQVYNGDYRNISFTNLGYKKYLINDSIYEGEDVYIEYLEEIELLEDFNNDNDIDLKEKYGINSSMCQYIKEYAQGKLLEQIDPALANMHLSRAENYFAGLKTISNEHHQNRIETKFLIGK